MRQEQITSHFRAGKIRLGKAKPPREAREGFSSCATKGTKISRLWRAAPASPCSVSHPKSLLLAARQCEGRVKATLPPLCQKYQRRITCKNDPFFLTRGRIFKARHAAPAHVSTQRHSSTPAPWRAGDTRGQTDACPRVPGFAPLITPPTGEKDKPKRSSCTKGGSL